MKPILGCWQGQPSGARLVCGPLSGSVRIDELSAAFVVEQWGGRPLNGLTVLSYFGPSLRMEPFEVSESYIRGGDFVATFAESGAQKIASQLYWRAAADERQQAVRIELVVSVKTDVLDSQPVSRVHSLINVTSEVLQSQSLDGLRLEPIELLGGHAENFHFTAEQSRERLFLFRMREHGLSFAQLVHPTDFVSAEVALDRQPPYSLLVNLFPERLERGVIRRARVCGWFLPCENDEQRAAELARQFVNEPLPLTA